MTKEDIIGKIKFNLEWIIARAQQNLGNVVKIRVREWSVALEP